MTQAATQPALGDTFDPIALNLVARHSPGAFAARFGATEARNYPGMSLRTAVEQVAARLNRPANVSALLTTDDFARIVTDTVHTAGIIAYDFSPPNILRVSHETREIENFKPVEKVRGGMFPALLHVPEGAEVTYGEIGEQGESYTAARYARLLEITEQAIVNDSLGLLVEPALRVGEATAELKGSIVAQRIEGNPVMSDGHAVFSDEHGNVAATGAPLSIESLSAARVAMRRQRQVDGERPMNVDPAFLVVPPELETTAEQLVASITAASTGTVNPFAGRLEVITDPRLTDPAAWYLFARPERQLALEHGGINGTADPEVRTEARLERHSVVTRVTVDFACGWVDWRGAYRNPGAAAQ